MRHWKNTFRPSRRSPTIIVVYNAAGQHILQVWHDQSHSFERTAPDSEAKPVTKDVPPLDLPRDESHTLFAQDIDPEINPYARSSPRHIP